MRKLAAVVLVLLLVIPFAGVDGKERSERGPSQGSEVRTDNRGRTFQSVGGLTIVRPTSGNASVELDAIVWVPVNRAKGVWCNGFDIVRSGYAATVTAFCKPPKRGGRVMAIFEVNAIEWEGNLGEGCDWCRDRHDMMKNAMFACTLDLPGSFDEAN